MKRLSLALFFVSLLSFISSCAPSFKARQFRAETAQLQQQQNPNPSEKELSDYDKEIAALETMDTSEENPNIEDEPLFTPVAAKVGAKIGQGSRNNAQTTSAATGRVLPQPKQVTATASNIPLKEAANSPEAGTAPAYQTYESDLVSAIKPEQKQAPESQDATAANIQVPYKPTAETAPEPQMEQVGQQDDQQAEESEAPSDAIDNSNPYTNPFPFRDRVILRKTRKASEKWIYDKIGDFNPPKTVLNQAQGSYNHGSLKNATNLLDLINQQESEQLVTTGSYRVTSKTYYSTQDTADLVFYLAQYSTAKDPTSYLEIGQAAAEHGGCIGGYARVSGQNVCRSHASHENGLDIDISYLMKDKKYNFRSIYNQVKDKNGNMVKEELREKNGKVVKDKNGNPKFVINQDVYGSLLVSEQWDLFKEGFRSGTVELFYVDPMVKEKICKEAIRQGDLKSKTQHDLYYEMLRRIVPYDGHDTHFHMRLVYDKNLHPNSTSIMGKDGKPRLDIDPKWDSGCFN